MKQNIKAFIYREDDGYVVECPDVHATTQGDTLDEAVSNLKEVVAMALEDGPGEYGLVANPAILVTLELEPLKRAGQAA